MHSVVRTPKGAEAAHKAGATTQLLVSLADPCPLIRQSAYGALLESLRHHTVRQAVALMRVDMTLPTVREHYVAAKPARKLEACFLSNCINLHGMHTAVISRQKWGLTAGRSVLAGVGGSTYQQCGVYSGLCHTRSKRVQHTAWGSRGWANGATTSGTGPTCTRCTVTGWHCLCH